MASAGVCWSTSPTCPRMRIRRPRSISTRACAVPRCIFPAACSRCCRRSCRTASVRSIRTSTGSVSCASSRSARAARCAAIAFSLVSCVRPRGSRIPKWRRRWWNASSRRASSASGEVRGYRFFEGLMRSAARLTYTEVAAAVVERVVKAREQVKNVLPQLERLHDLYNVLRTRRDKRGAIDFDAAETRVVFGRTGKLDRIVPLLRNDAHRLIEEYMVAANVAAAEFLLEKKMPALYRVHAGPTVEKLLDLRAFLAELGLSLGGGDDPQPKHYAQLLDSVRDRPDARLIQTVLLRRLSQAVYSPDNTGHFGLAYEAYTHFTSPIRRYPDLLVHRAIRHAVASGRATDFGYSHNDMVSAGEHCSMTERRADEATRDAMDWLKCEYMQDKVGEVFEGLITSVTSFGLFVELRDIYVEGLVH